MKNYFHKVLLCAIIELWLKDPFGLSSLNQHGLVVQSSG
jgi:hypothetical protein